MPSFLQTIAATFSRELIVHTAARLGEGEKAIKKALEGAVALILNAMVGKVEAGNPQLVEEWSWQAYRNTSRNLVSVTGVLGMLGSDYAPGSALAQGETLLAALFGEARQAVSIAVRNYANIKPLSARVLLSLASAVLPALLMKSVVAHQQPGLTAPALLLGLKNSVRNLLAHDLLAQTSLDGVFRIVGVPDFRMALPYRIIGLCLVVAVLLLSVWHYSNTVSRSLAISSPAWHPTGPTAEVPRAAMMSTLL
jgi:hypothetical protein